jgi:hypothetical protein
MYLASDYIHPYKDARGRPARCRVRIYLPDDVLDPPVVVCSVLPNNPGGSITNSAETIAAGVIRANRLPTPLVWIEHWPKESTGGGRRRPPARRPRAAFYHLPKFVRVRGSRSKRTTWWTAFV